MQLCVVVAANPESPRKMRVPKKCVTEPCPRAAGREQLPQGSGRLAVLGPPSLLIMATQVCTQQDELTECGACLCPTYLCFYIRFSLKFLMAVSLGSIVILIFMCCLPGVTAGVQAIF